MLMVIFGAGASYDSAPAYPPPEKFIVPSGLEREQCRPPLANQLFENRPLFANVLLLLPRTNAVVPPLRDSSEERPLEHELQELRDEAERYPRASVQLAAVRYYLHEMLWECENEWKRHVQGITNHKALLNRIECWRLAEKSESALLVTFNYDTLLEDALNQDFGTSFQSVGDYMTQLPHYKVFKLHGSVNWAREVDDGIGNFAEVARDPWAFANGLIDRVRDLKISQRYKVVRSHPIVYEDGKTLFPAIAIPVETKSDFECPAQHLEALRECIPQVSKLLVIGWRAREEHFLEFLRQSKLPKQLRLMVVARSPEGGKEIVATLQDKLGIGLLGRGPYWSGGGFTDFIKSREVDLFLSG